MDQEAHLRNMIAAHEETIAKMAVDLQLYQEGIGGVLTAISKRNVSFESIGQHLRAVLHVTGNAGYIARGCPDCGDGLLTPRPPQPTAFEGVLRYFDCDDCGRTYVIRGDELAEAAGSVPKR